MARKNENDGRIFGRPDGWQQQWRAAMHAQGRPQRTPAVVEVGVRVTVGRMTLEMLGDKIPAPAVTTLREVTRGGKPRKMPAPKFVVGAVAGAGVDFSRWQTAQYHRALQTGEWAA